MTKAQKKQIIKNIAEDMFNEFEGLLEDSTSIIQDNIENSVGFGELKDGDLEEIDDKSFEKFRDLVYTWFKK